MEIAVSTMEANILLLARQEGSLPTLDIINNLDSTVGLFNGKVTCMHIRIQGDYVGALTLAKLEPKSMTPHSKHHTIK